MQLKMQVIGGQYVVQESYFFNIETFCSHTKNKK